MAAERVPTAPAQTYHLNTLASVLGRFAAPDISPRSAVQLDNMLDNVIDTLAEDIPSVPHTSPVLLQEALVFDHKLQQTLRGPAERYVSAGRMAAIEDRLDGHVATCRSMVEKNASFERLVDPQDIANTYGLPDLWEDADRIIQEEINTWGQSRTHPAIPDALTAPVRLDETRELMRLMWRKVIQVPPPEVHAYFVDDAKHYHVFWAPLAETLDYGTPRIYDRATQLSFDLPHNATHLAHLAAIDPSEGAARYDDSPAIRAYFEAATVFSERKTIDVAECDPEFAQEMSEIFRTGPPIRPAELARWIADDRKYEFKLRAVRYAADILMIQGVPFEDATRDIARRFGVDPADAAKEVRKYVPWTGLGAVYTFGYRKLESLGVERVADVIYDRDGTAITSWSQKLQD